jgi:hypothetical protein
MAKVNLGTAISPKKLNVLAQITAKTVIWLSNGGAVFLSTVAVEPRALACRLWHEAASHRSKPGPFVHWGISMKGWLSRLLAVTSLAGCIAAFAAPA